MTTASGAPAWRGGHQGTWAGVALAALTWTADTPAAAQAQVYRCQAPGGVIEFRQEPCAPGTTGDALTIEDHPIGWTPAPAGQGAAQKAAPKPRKQAVTKGRGGASAKERREETCRKKRQQVEDIDRRLRLGTKGRQGADLRHRRRGYEDFLYEQCD